MKKSQVFFVAMTQVTISLMSILSPLLAQTLGSTKGNNLQIAIMTGATGNSFSNRSWLVRNADGIDWTTAHLHDGLSIDGSFLTPQTNTRTWWERDPYNNIQTWGSADQTYFAINNGRIGIGTSSPVSKLNIVDQATNGWLISAKAVAVVAGQINGLKFISGYPDDNNKWAGIASVAEDQHSNNTGLALYAGTTEKVRITSNGNLGIGTTSPAEKLSVNGNIRAKEIKVETANWPDYVFEENYNLPDLEQIANYIKRNKRLPGMPSASEVKQDGISLGEMNKKLLEKLEETTLQLIKLKQEVEILKDIVSQHYQRNGV